MSNTRIILRIARRAGAALLSAALLACADEPSGPGGPGEPEALVPTKVAAVEWEGPRPALYLQRADGTGRTRVHFAGAEDPFPGQSPYLPHLDDEHVIALGHVRWSPDGARLAVVVTLAHDQSEIVVIDSTGQGARVASPNMQVITTDVAWSADGTRLLYGMSTQPRAGAAEVFVTDLARNEVHQVTRGAQLGWSARLRFAAGDGAVLLSRVVAEGGAPLFEQVSRVERIDFATGASGVVADRIAGEVQAVGGDADWALAIRRVAIGAGGAYEQRLVRVPLVPSDAERVLVDGGTLQWATAAAGPAHDAEALALVALGAASGSSSTYELVASGAPRVRLPGLSATATSVDVWATRGRRP
jgi:hypothetical protein